MTDFPNLTIVDHPLVWHKLRHLRDRNTPRKLFSELVDELTVLLAYEVTRDLHTEETEVETPMERATCRRLESVQPVVVPVLRAGLGMVQGMMRMIPTAAVGHVGLSRDEETLEPVEYYFNLPPRAEARTFIVVDPMLATGGSARCTVRSLRERGARDVRLMCLVAAPEGVDAMREEHPDVPIFAAALDRELNEDGFILPGLGDAGDRLYGTL